jgi:hypothetical protein
LNLFRSRGEEIAGRQGMRAHDVQQVLDVDMLAKDPMPRLIELQARRLIDGA